MKAGRTLALAGLLVFALVGCAVKPNAKSDAEPSIKGAAEGKTANETSTKKKPANAAYEDARALAKKDGKLLLLAFSADWCPPCKELHKAMKEDLLFTEELKNYLVVEVEIEDEASKDIKEKFYPDGGIPFVIVLKPEDESRVTEVLGFESSLPMVQQLKAAREKA